MENKHAAMETKTKIVIDRSFHSHFYDFFIKSMSKFPQFHFSDLIGVLSCSVGASQLQLTIRSENKNW
jgi:lipoprotein signal peptidase